MLGAGVAGCAGQARAFRALLLNKEGDVTRRWVTAIVVDGESAVAVDVERVGDELVAHGDASAA